MTNVIFHSRCSRFARKRRNRVVERISTRFASSSRGSVVPQSGTISWRARTNGAQMRERGFRGRRVVAQEVKCSRKEAYQNGSASSREKTLTLSLEFSPHPRSVPAVVIGTTLSLITRIPRVPHCDLSRGSLRTQTGSSRRD